MKMNDLEADSDFYDSELSDDELLNNLRKPRN